MTAMQQHHAARFMDQLMSITNLSRSKALAPRILLPTLPSCCEAIGKSRIIKSGGEPPQYRSELLTNGRLSGSVIDLK